MSRYAKLDLSKNPPIVIGWFDTSIFEYTEDFESAEFVKVDDATWNNRGGKQLKFVDNKIAEHTNLSELITQKLYELNNSCRLAIEAGFESDALGSNHVYPTNNNDQCNLLFDCIMSLKNSDHKANIWCMSVDPSKPLKWEMLEHNSEQLVKLGEKYRLFISENQLKLNELVKRTKAATSINELLEIVW